MRIEVDSGNVYENKNMYVSSKQNNEKYAADYKKADEAADSVEISAKAYEMQGNEISAVSGEDTLDISRGKNKYSFVIHFQDSGVVSRVIARGYVTVNGIDIQLSEDDKKQLSKWNEQVLKAQKDREKAYDQYALAAEAKAAMEQGEAIKDAADKMGQALLIASRMCAGIQVTAADERFLFKYDPKLYAMAKTASSLINSHGKREKKSISDESEEDKTKNQQEGIEETWSSWKSYETTMEVSLEGVASVGNIEMHELTINSGE